MLGSSLRKRLVSTLIVWVSVCLTVTAQTYRSGQLRQRELGRAHQKLLHAHIFNFGGVGFVRRITEEEKAFNLIFESIDAEKVFQQLVREANAEGQLYALFGLRAKSSASFENEAQRIRTGGGSDQRQEELTLVPKGKVRIGHGCILSEADMLTVVDEIAKGKWDWAFYSDRESALIPRPKTDLIVRPKAGLVPPPRY